MAAKAKAKARVKAGRKLNVKHFEALLQSERERLLKERERMLKRRSEAIEGAVPDESWESEDDATDLSVSIMEKEIALSVEDDLEEMLEAIDKAFEKLENNTYGVCDICNEEIALARLEAIPWATLCINCKSLVEDLS